jgi:hypothetical protein
MQREAKRHLLVFTQAFERMAPYKCLAPGLSSYMLIINSRQYVFQ